MVKKIISFLPLLITALFVVLYPWANQQFDLPLNWFGVIPILLISARYGTLPGFLIGAGISIFISINRLLVNDPNFVLQTAFISAIIASVGGGLIGRLSDQEKRLKESEEQLEFKIQLQTSELNNLVDELQLAYTSTLEGWAKALELNDKETEGHSRRVTNLAWKLAKAMNVPQDELIHIRNGALLHDIGKMGIAAEILNKPGPLTLEERDIVECHSQIAFDLLKDISFLQKAIEIPYCHHEKWNGQGYPKGLKGTTIPFSARLFAVVDVWDALSSDRPYRKAWKKEKVIEYMLEESGEHFDPEIVNVFLNQIIEN